MSENYVPPEGPRDAKIVLLAECPGESEAKVGRPFVGQAGKLLTHLLAQAGILRQDCYITHVVKERPPSGDIKKLIDVTKKVPVVTEKGEGYLRNLRVELGRLNPNVIVPLGNVGLWALTGKRGTMKWRSSVIEGLGKKVIPTIHPATALRDYDSRYLIHKDLQRIAKHQHYPEVPVDHRTYIVRPSLQQIHEYLDTCLKSGVVAFDIECTRSKEVTCISFSYHGDHAISIPFVEYARPYFLLPEEAHIWRRITDLLEDDQIIKIAHNATFDSTLLYRRYGIRTNNLHDTMVASGLIHPGFKKNLGAVTAWWTTMPYYKDEGKESFHSQDNEQFWTYNAKDSCVLMEAYPKMIKEMTQAGNLDTFHNQCRLIPVLTYMTERGLKVDHSTLAGKQDEIGQQIKELRVLLNGVVGYEINPLSPKQLIDYFYEVEGYAPYKSRTTGRPTVDEKALKRLARKDHCTPFF